MCRKEPNVWPLMLPVATLSELEAKYGVEFTFVSDSQDVAPVAEDAACQSEEFDSFFVLTEDGDYVAVYGMYGIVPYTGKTLRRMLPKPAPNGWDTIEA